MSPQGRYVMMPRGDERFVGSRGRARARARDRRRRVVSVLGEVTALTALIGAFPPLRAMWFMTAFFVAVLGGYLVALLRMQAVRQHEVVGQTVVLPESDLAVVRSVRVLPVERAVS